MLTQAREVEETKEATEEEAEVETFSLSLMIMKNIEELILINSSSKHDKMKMKDKCQLVLKLSVLTKSQPLTEETELIEVEELEAEAEDKEEAVMAKQDKDHKLLLKEMMIHDNHTLMIKQLREVEVEEVKEEEATVVVTEDKRDLKLPTKETSLRSASMREIKTNSTMEAKVSNLTSKMTQEEEEEDKEEAVKSRTKTSLDLLLRFLMMK